MERIRALFPFLLAVACARPLAAAAPPDPARPFRDARLTGAARDAAGVTIPLGAGTYTFASGTLWEIAAADGAPAGFYFEGKGTLAWGVLDEEAAHVFAGNARRIGGFDVPKKGPLTTPVTRASFWLSPELRPALEGFAPREAPPAAAFAQHAKRFARDQVTPAALGLAAARLGAGPYAQVLVEGKKDVRHEVDGAFSGDERLAVVATLEAAPVGFVDWRLARSVGVVPVGRGLYDPPAAAAKLTELDVDVREGDEGYGALAVKETYVPARPLRALALQLATDTLGHRGLSSRATRLDSVTDDEGHPLGFAFEKDALVVDLGRTAPAGAPVRLSFAYEAGFFEPRLGSNAWELALGQGWYPAPFPFRAASSFTYHAVVRAKKPLLAFTSGDTVRRAEEERWNLVETRLATPVATVGVLAGPYSVVEETRDGLTCRMASYTVPKPKASARLFEVVHLFRKFYEARLGPFPWKELTVAESAMYGGGQATPGLIVASKDLFLIQPPRTRDGHLLPEGIDRHVAHELAHAWFGHRTWGASEKEQWLEEAFPEVLSAAALDALGEPSEAQRIVNVWKLDAGDARKEGTIRLANAMSDKATLMSPHHVGKDRYALVYGKGAWLLWGLRKERGDGPFFAAVRAFLEAHPGPVTTDEFAAFLSARSWKDVKPLFARVVDGREMP